MKVPGSNGPLTRETEPAMPWPEVEATLTAPGKMFEIAEAEVRGARLRVWKNAPASLRDLLEISRLHGDKTFLVYEDERTTFEEHFRQVAALAHRLMEHYGVRKGDRVAIAMRNFPEWSAAFWAAAAVGAVVVPLNAWWATPELVYGLTDSGSKVVFVDGERLDRLVPELAELDLAVVVARAEGEVPDGVARYEDVLGEVPDGVALPAVTLEAEDDATIFYTSGTTGAPKGVLGTHRNICGNLLSLAYAREAAALRSGTSAGGSAPDTSQPSYLLSVPFFHATGCHSVLVANLAAGGKLVLMHKWDPERALELIERERVTTFGGVPTMVWQVLQSPDFGRRDTSSVTSVGYGGAPAPPELVRRIEELLPGRIPSNGYGLTETSSVTTVNVGIDYLRRPDSVGRPVPVVDVRVVDHDGRALPAGEVGELWIRGPNVVRGYWNRPEATAAAITDGWLRSGDLARLDDEGLVYIVDRAKDMLIRGGENVYCAEVEAALFEHPAVYDAAVIGIPHRELGEEVGAVVRLKEDASASADELRRHVGERLAAFKVPVKVWFVDDELPRNPAGKLLKRELRDLLLG
ncbi:AMP-binding protein [Actinocorallia sp. B10E7]|uniref:class I adenylate-forming enzyme family protein n=1 Tax=Actinocorallia sp. B10E7 TaxID=3153558 RepID=UPI00325E8FC8